MAPDTPEREHEMHRCAALPTHKSGRPYGRPLFYNSLCRKKKKADPFGSALSKIRQDEALDCS